MPISNTVYHRLRIHVLRPAKLSLSDERSREAAQRLVDIAAYTLAMLYSRASRTRAPKNGLGRPRHQAVNELIGNLAGFWLEYAGTSATASCSQKRHVHEGKFVRFAQSFCRELATDLPHALDPQLADDLDTLRRGTKTPVEKKARLAAVRFLADREKPIAQLLDIYAHPRKVYTRLRAINLPQFRQRIAKQVASQT